MIKSTMASFAHLADKKCLLHFPLLVILFVLEKMSYSLAVACYVICSGSETFEKLFTDLL